MFYGKERSTAYAIRLIKVIELWIVVFILQVNCAEYNSVDIFRYEQTIPPTPPTPTSIRYEETTTRRQQSYGTSTPIPYEATTTQRKLTSSEEIERPPLPAVDVRILQLFKKCLTTNS